MHFERLFHATSTYAHPPDLDAAQLALPEEWLSQALSTTETATLRRRRLPGEQVLWLLIAMGLFRRLPIAECVKRLDLALPGVGAIAKSSVSEARTRLGPKAIAHLFERSATAWALASAQTHAYRGLSVFGIDGTTLRVPDTPENRALYPGHRARNETEGSYPLLRMVVLMALRSHLVLDASFGAHAGKDTHELHYAKRLVGKIPESSLTLVDRAYLSAAFLLPFEPEITNKHWMTRVRKNTVANVVKRLGKGDEIVEMAVSPEARRKDPSLPETWTARRIQYRRKGFQPSAVLTSLQDAQTYPANELVALYHERWELELSYRDVKSTMLDREEAIRSKTPERVQQELWGILLAYNLVRLEIERVAKASDVAPTQVSFIAALRILRSEWEWLPLDSPGAIPKRLAQMRQDLAECIFERRPRPAYPRAVKIKMSNYPRKKPTIELGT
jgi:Transposase DDE domain/Insertion element 4 transposase N-terminal